MYYVYILKSLKDNKYYIGQTENINRRLFLHNSGKVISTKFRRPLILVGFKKFDSRSKSRWFEYNLKHHSDKKYGFIKLLEAYR